MCYKFRLLLLIMCVFLMSSCKTGFEARESKLQSWLAEAKRPIKVTKHHPYQHLSASRGSHYYTLIDANGKVYLAENVRFVLPDVIQ